MVDKNILYLHVKLKDYKMRQLHADIGLKFGYWTVIDNNNIIRSGHSYVKVRCKCGKEDYKNLGDLIRGTATGCRNCKARERSRKIKIGDKYKKWTVIDGPISNRYQTIMWLCKCECGTERWMQGNELTDMEKCFQCQKCAGIYRGIEQTKKNGRCGQLTRNRYTKLQKSAAVRNIVFDVSIEYLWQLFEAQNYSCAITGDYIGDIKAASLDRIDSSIGYIIGNVQWVTKQANLSKHIMSMNELYDFCRKVLNHANQQPSTPLTKCEGSETNT